jgi:hypothetical protein
MVQFVIEFTKQADESDRFRWFRKLSIQRPLAESRLMTKRFCTSSWITDLKAGRRLSPRTLQVACCARQNYSGSRVFFFRWCVSVGSQAVQRLAIGRTSQCRGHKSIAHVTGSFAFRPAMLAVRDENYRSIKFLADRRHRRAR